MNKLLLVFEHCEMSISFFLYLSKKKKLRLKLPNLKKNLYKFGSYLFVYVALSIKSLI